MADYGGFIHRSETDGTVWANMAFAAIRLANGRVEDSNMVTHWKEAGINPKRMIYDNPGNVAIDVNEAASFFIQAVNNLQASQGSTWREQPIVVNINQPYISLLWLQSYVSYMEDNLLVNPHPKMILFTTADKWRSIQIDSPDGEHMRDNILSSAELMVSEYGNIANPTLPIGIGKVRWWEYKPGFFEFKEDGRFNHALIDVPPVVVPPVTPPVVTPVYSNRFDCLRMAMDILFYNGQRTPVDVTTPALFELADKLIEYVNRKV
jgi:hypothetical protein